MYETKENDILTTTRELVNAQHGELVALHSQWLIVSLFCRGFQNIGNYDPYTTSISLSSNSGRSTYNLFRQTLQRSKSILMQSPPRKQAKPTRDDEIAIESARLHTIVMDDFYHRFKIDEKSQIVADGFLKSGVFVVSFFLDPTKGDIIGQHPDGRPIRTGMLCPRFDPPERWIWDPRAIARDEVMVACRRTIQPIEKMIEMFPDKEQQLRALETDICDEDLLETRLLNSTQRQGLYGRGSRGIRGKGRVVCFEVFEDPCPAYPQGRMATLAGSTTEPVLVCRDYGALHTGEIPAVLFVQDVDAHSLLGGGSFFNDLVPAQQEINKRANLDVMAADLTGNPRLLVPLRGGTPVGDFTDEVGEIVTYDPQDGEPHYMFPPQQSEFAVRSKEWAMQAFSMMALTSPADISRAEKTTSGFHAALIAEERKNSASPMVRQWEIGWESVYRMYVRLFRRLVIFPQQLRSIGPRGQIAYEAVSGLDLNEGDVEINVVPYSSMPTSRTAAFAEWSELLKLGYGRIDTALRPEVERRMLEDIGKGDMTATWRDVGLDIENAKYIVSQIRIGQPVAPRVQDDPNVIIEEIMSFMKTDDYRIQLRSDPMLETRCTQALALFGTYKAIRDQQSMMAQANAQATAQMVAASGMSGSANPVQAANQTFAPGAPMGGADPKMTQGMSRAPNANKNVGGNPG